MYQAIQVLDKQRLEIRGTFLRAACQTLAQLLCQLFKHQHIDCGHKLLVEPRLVLGLGEGITVRKSLQSCDFAVRHFSKGFRGFHQRNSPGIPLYTACSLVMVKVPAVDAVITALHDRDTIRFDTCKIPGKNFPFRLKKFFQRKRICK